LDRQKRIHTYGIADESRPLPLSKPFITEGKVQFNEPSRVGRLRCKPCKFCNLWLLSRLGVANRLVDSDRV
jgi:hypothetical protein